MKYKNPSKFSKDGIKKRDEKVGYWEGKSDIRRATKHKYNLNARESWEVMVVLVRFYHRDKEMRFEVDKIFQEIKKFDKPIDRTSINHLLNDLFGRKMLDRWRKEKVRRKEYLYSFHKELKDRGEEGIWWWLKGNSQVIPRKGGEGLIEDGWQKLREEALGDI